jgi:hypothetical protein
MMITDSLSERAAGVEVLPEADELDLRMIEFVQHFKDAPHGIGSPGSDRPDPAAGQGRGRREVFVFPSTTYRTSLTSLPQVDAEPAERRAVPSGADSQPRAFSINYLDDVPLTR